MLQTYKMSPFQIRIQIQSNENDCFGIGDTAIIQNQLTFSNAQFFICDASAILIQLQYISITSVFSQVEKPCNGLILSPVYRRHTANDTGTARNTHNTTRIVWNVRVIDAPQPPTPCVLCSTEDAVHLTWTPDKDTGGMPLVG